MSDNVFPPTLLTDVARIRQAAIESEDGQRCVVAPHPDLREKIREEIRSIKARRDTVIGIFARAAEPQRPGFNDGLIIPGVQFPLGTPLSVIRNAAAERAPLRGIVRVIVVLVDFSDKHMTQTPGHFTDLFFSTGVIPTKSVREYFTEVTNGLVDIQGEVVGPFRMPMTLAQYANGAAGIGNALPNARTMARDAVAAADPSVNFTPYDNDSNGFVDAFIVVHAGRGGEETGSSGDIWSHKWVLDGGARAVDSTQIYGYLTVPEDARIGVCCHELGHLLFGFPDLYDTDGTSEGIGNWCLMAGGSWGGGGNTPVHASAWCKANQGWVLVDNRTTNSMLSIPDVKDSQTVYRLWKDGGPGTEYFLMENRQQNRFDASLPGSGLLIWHIDEATPGNTNEAHYKVALIQADGKRDMENDRNRGDAGDPYPGSSNNTVFNNTSTPNSKSYAGASTCVSVAGIGPAGPVMTTNVQVRCIKRKEIAKEKEWKELRKEKERKEILKERKESAKEKELRKDTSPEKRPEKPDIDKSVSFDKGFADKPRDGKLVDGGKLIEGGKFGEGGQFGGGGFAQPGGMAGTTSLEERIATLEAIVLRMISGGVSQSMGESMPQPFIGSELRPDLSQGALMSEEDYSAQQQMQLGSAEAKRSYDSKMKEQ
jgi:immune inhibitor A